MNLSDFVSDTLVEIMTGVVSAQKRWGEGGEKGHINPLWGGYTDGAKSIREVNFDVAVTVSDSESGDAKGGIKVLGIGEIGATTKGETVNSRVSRIAFSVPIAPPIVFLGDE